MAKKSKTLNNVDIDIESVNYREEVAEEVINKRMGIYSFNVNLERSMPNVRDGLKPSQRKVIYAGYAAGFRSNKSFYKALRYIGEVSKYYVHGDASAYSTMMNMSQDFYCKYPMIESYGNNGSIFGDSPAAPRYVEARLSKYTDTMLSEFSQASVDWVENYDGTLKEPTVLPVIYPNLLLCGSYGIGQAYATSIPSHNFDEVVEKVIQVIENPDISIDELVKDFAPDYPTGGIIINKKDLPQMYKTGKGMIKLRGEVEIDRNNNLIIKSIPYMKDTGKILDSIQRAIKTSKIEGISTIKDDSNANGIKITLITKRGYDPKTIEQQLYMFTPLQDTITFQLLCTTSEELSYKYYNLKEIIEEWLDFRRTTIKRNYNSKIAIAKKKIHIDEGLLIALDPKILDKIIKMIRNSNDTEEVIQNLIKDYKMTTIQAEYIGNLKLTQLTNMEIGKIKEDLETQKKLVEEYMKMFINKNIDKYIIDLLKDGAKKFGSPRITKLADIDENNIEATIDNTNHVIFITNQGFIKKIDAGKIKTQNSKGMGINVGKIKDDDYIISTINCENLDQIFFFTNKGRLLNLKVFEIKDCNLNSYGVLLDTMLKFNEGERVVTALKVDEADYTNDAFLLFATKNGLIKKSSTILYKNAPKNGFCAVDLNKDDILIGVKCIKYDMDIIVATDNGSVIRYNSSSIPTTKRTTKGVKSIELSEGENVVSFDSYDNKDDSLCVVTNKGNGKRIVMTTLPSTDRTKKVKPLCKLGRSEKVVSAFFVGEDDEITIVGNKKIIKIPANQVPEKLKVSSADKIVSIKSNESILLATK